jgi:RNA polymerase sigma factor (sigma-70 family)
MVHAVPKRGLSGKNSANVFPSGDVSMGMKAEYTADMQALLAQAGWLRRFARALLGGADEAEDLAQDTLVAVWRHPGGGGRAWLAAVARNLAVDRFRSDARRKRREEAARDCGDGRVGTPEELIGNAQIHRKVAEAVANLAEPFRQALVLRFYQCLSSAEIARKLHEPEATIRWRVKEGLDRVRRELDAGHGNDRSAWVAAMAPLLPRPNTVAPCARPLRSARTLPAPLYLAAALAVLSVAIIAIGLRTPSGRVATNDPAPSTGNAPAPRPTPAARLNLASPAAGQVDAVAALVPGPGPADAQSLAGELLRAIQGNDYDAFVAKGSASFRAAVATAGFASLSANLAGRLAQGHRVATLGSVRRPETVDWIFKIEFSDDGDDALLTLGMDGWQVAGFLINEPITLPVEKSP